MGCHSNGIIDRVTTYWRGIIMEMYPRGSEWRRWDLHIHTPGTQKNDCFEGKSQNEKWDKFYTNIDEYIGLTPDADKDVVAIGITDYLSIDNYLKVRNDNRLLQKKT
jgi:hypothetical protein